MEKAFAIAKQAAKGLPEIEESTWYNAPALKVRGKALMRVKDVETLVVMCQLEEKQMLMQAAPDIYFETDHYKGWPAILVRAFVISNEELHHRLKKAWIMQAPRSLQKHHPELL